MPGKESDLQEVLHKHRLFIHKVIIHEVPEIPSKVLVCGPNHCSLGEFFISTLIFSNRLRKSMSQTENIGGAFSDWYVERVFIPVSTLLRNSISKETFTKMAHNI